MNGGSKPPRTPGKYRQVRNVRGLAIVGALLLISQWFVETVLAGPLEFLQPSSATTQTRSAQMLLEADRLVYDYDRNLVSAVGNVTIHYVGYVLIADQVVYNRRTARLVAHGQVRIIDPSGSVATAASIDITDDFRDGFVQSLQLETIDRTFFTAESAERVAGDRTVFTQGTYTACEPCLSKPGRPPKWQVRAGTVIIDEKRHEIIFQNASLEFFGFPVAYLPVFWTPDSTVKRRTGFLIPSVAYSSALGAQLVTPYFIALAPNYDVTFTPRLMSRQGVLGELEWRHRLSNGQYSIKVAGTTQADSSAFFTGDGLGGSYAQKSARGGVRTTGEFYLNRQWTTGWDATLLSDRTFTRHYSVLNKDSDFTVSQLYLNGMSDRNYFDARAHYFQVLTDRNKNWDASAPAPASHPEFAKYDQNRQAVVYPVADHDYTFDQAFLGGEVKVHSNLTNLSRQTSDWLNFGPMNPGREAEDVLTRGPAGTFARFSTEADWQRQIVGLGGMVFMPFGYARGDAFLLNSTDPLDQLNSGLTSANSVGRGMAAVGLEWTWPWLLTNGGSAHVIGPRAQLIVRPSEMWAGVLPNNDAQSLVFDDSSLFAWDKFSGWDRVEGGTRLNIAMQYTGTFDAGTTIDALVGESIHLAGLNSFAVTDLTGIGPGSGLETTWSDIVSRLSLTGPSGHSITARGRFDESNFLLNRGELEAAGPIGPFTASTGLVFIRGVRPETDSAALTNAFVIRGAASTNFVENWRAFGSFAYDIHNASLIGRTLGLAYDDECLSFSIAYNVTQANYSDIVPTQEVWMRVELRTLGATTLVTGRNSPIN
jgi:LPS-assembly protein